MYILLRYYSQQSAFHRLLTLLTNEIVAKTTDIVDNNLLADPLKVCRMCIHKHECLLVNYVVLDAKAGLPSSAHCTMSYSPNSVQLCSPPAVIPVYSHNFSLLLMCACLIICSQSLCDLKLALRVCAAFRGCYLDYKERADTWLKTEATEHTAGRYTHYRVIACVHEDCMYTGIIVTCMTTMVPKTECATCTAASGLLAVISKV